MSEADRHPAVRVERVELLSTIAGELIGELNRELTEQYPEEGACFFRLDPEEVAPGRGGFFVAWANDRPVGCGAIRLVDADRAEIKRMYVRRESRGQRISAAILDVLESEAARLGATCLVLETGNRQREAIGLYRRRGFTDIAAFGEYGSSPLSLYLGKSLQPRPSAT